MRSQLKTPCKNCPFANRETRIKFRCAERAEEIAEGAYRNGFPCHLSAEPHEDDDGETSGYVFGEKTQHCAGAIGMFLNDNYTAWPGLDNREIDASKWTKAMAVAFESEEAFIAANAGDIINA
jgi:hypothetical protein